VSARTTSGERVTGLEVPFGPGATRWGDAARALADELGGRWPASPEAQLALCRFVHYRASGGTGPRWVVDDVAGFAAAAGARRAGGAGVQLALDLRSSGR